MLHGALQTERLPTPIEDPCAMVRLVVVVLGDHRSSDHCSHLDDRRSCPFSRWTGLNFGLAATGANVRNGSKADISVLVSAMGGKQTLGSAYSRMTEASDGKPVFRIAFGRRLHISGWPAILLAPLAIPIILLLLLGERLLGLKSTADLTPEDVENYLRNFLEGRDGAWDWDDFTSIPIADRTLDAIREQAAFVRLPLNGAGRATLEQLLRQVQSL